MAGVPYTPNPASIPKFLQHIQSAGVPQKVNLDYLTSVGFKSSNDRYLISILKSIDFLDPHGVPTDRWRTYRNKATGRGVLGSAIRHGYQDLFVTYPNAHERDSEALRNFFSSRSDLAATTLERAVQTFKTLCGVAAFSAQDEPLQTPAQSQLEAATVSHAAASKPGLPAININIQLQLPATDDAGVYEKLFAALRKHLLDDGSATP